MISPKGFQEITIVDGCLRSFEQDTIPLLGFRSYSRDIFHPGVARRVHINKASQPQCVIEYRHLDVLLMNPGIKSMI